MSQARQAPPWTVEEELIMFDLVKTIGKLWGRIAAALPGRTENGVRNRWARCVTAPLSDRATHCSAPLSARAASQPAALISPAPLCVSVISAWRSANW